MKASSAWALSIPTGVLILHSCIHLLLYLHAQQTCIGHLLRARHQGHKDDLDMVPALKDCRIQWNSQSSLAIFIQQIFNIQQNKQLARLSTVLKQLFSCPIVVLAIVLGVSGWHPVPLTQQARQTMVHAQEGLVSDSLGHEPQTLYFLEALQMHYVITS